MLGKRLVALVLRAIIGLGGVIVVEGLLSTDQIGTHLDPWTPGHIGSYSYSDPNCSTNRKDPIQIVYYNNATSVNVGYHSAHHGWPDDPGADPQYFFDHGCTADDGERANGSGTRYHQRWETAWTEDNYWDTYSFATPHFEDYVWPECGYFGAPKHAVRENNPEADNMPEGGFINAKHEIDQWWTNNWPGGETRGHHHWWGSQDWDNVDWMKECDDQFAWGNGIVDFIEVKIDAQ